MGRYRHRPLHLFGGIGLLMGAAGFLILLYLTAVKIGGGADRAPALLTLGVLLIVVGVPVDLPGPALRADHVPARGAHGRAPALGCRRRGSPSLAPTPCETDGRQVRFGGERCRVARRRWRLDSPASAGSHRERSCQQSNLRVPASLAVRHTSCGLRWVRVVVRLGALGSRRIPGAAPTRALAGEPGLTSSTANTSILAIAAIVSLVAVVAYGSVWPYILRRIGAPVPRDSIRLFLQSQLGKYLPGSVWHYAGARRARALSGVGAVRSTLVSLGVEVGASALAAAIVGLFVLPLALAIPLAVAAAGVVAILASRQARHRKGSSTH